MDHKRSTRRTTLWPKACGLWPRRRASALITVLIVIVMLTLGAYTFVEFMLIEANATNRASRLAQSQASADSGVDYLATLLSNREEVVTENLFHNQSMFAGVIMQENGTAHYQKYIRDDMDRYAAIVKKLNLQIK